MKRKFAVFCTATGLFVGLGTLTTEISSAKVPFQIVPANVHTELHKRRAPESVITGAAGVITDNQRYAARFCDSKNLGKTSLGKQPNGLDLPNATIKKLTVEAKCESLDRGSVVGSAKVEARGITLLNGLVTAEKVTRSITVKNGHIAYSGKVSGLTIAGKKIGSVTKARSVDLSGKGMVYVNNSGNGLLVKLDKPLAGFPAGVGVAVASIGVKTKSLEWSNPEFDLEPNKHAQISNQKIGNLNSNSSPDSFATKLKQPLPGRIIVPQANPGFAAVSKNSQRIFSANLLTRNRFVFPIYGPATVSDDFGAPRQIGAHQGNDILAPYGAPVLAITDGVVEKVGTTPISGNRLWLRSTSGDLFFYAHLSSFSPAAVNGMSVKAGTVLGGVGNTGDAVDTPFHLHFEMHPAGGKAIDPFPVLRSLQTGSDIRVTPDWKGPQQVAVNDWTDRTQPDSDSSPQGTLVELSDPIAESS